MNQKLKRIFAWIGIILLVGLYVSTLVFALIGSAHARQLLGASVAATLIVPVLLYVMIRAPYLFTKDPWVDPEAEKEETGEASDGDSEADTESDMDSEE